MTFVMWVRRNTLHAKKKPPRLKYTGARFAVRVRTGSLAMRVYAIIDAALQIGGGPNGFVER